MVNRQSIFVIHGENSSIIALGVAANLLWSFFRLITAFYILVVRGGTIEGVMYMGFQGFHDFKQDIDELSNYRGSHIFADAAR